MGRHNLMTTLSSCVVFLNGIFEVLDIKQKMFENIFKNSFKKIKNLIVIFVNYFNGFKHYIRINRFFNVYKIKQTVRQSGNEYRCRCKSR